MAVEVVSWVIAHAPKDLRPSEMLVAMLLAEHARSDGTHAYPSVPELAQETRLGQRTVQLGLKELCRRGVIEIEGAATNRLPTMYRFPGFGGAEIAPPERARGALSAPLGGANGTPHEPVEVQFAHLGVQSTALGAQNATSRGADSADKPLERTISKPSEDPSGRGAPPQAKQKPKQRATVLPDDWDEQQVFQGPDGLYAWAHRELGMSVTQVDFETDKFMDYWRGEGATKVDWLATWRNWMRRSRDGLRGRGR